MMKLQRRITQAYFNRACCQYAPLIQKLAFQIGTSKIQIEELKVQAIEELLKCMICYHRSGSFMTFFYGRLSGIFRHIQDTERRVKRIQIMSLDSMMNMAGPDCDVDSHMLIQEYLKCLNDNEREIILGLFFHEKTMREVSEDCGMAPSTICRIKARAIGKMRQKCEMELG